MAIKKRTLADINININVNTSGKVKKRKKKKKPTKSRLIQAPNFGSVSPIFPAYLYGTAENSMVEQEKFKNKDLSNMLRLTQGELTESKKLLLENTPQQSVKRSDPSPTIASTFISNVDLGTLPSKAPTLARQGSNESAISMRSESLRSMRENKRTVEEDIERLARGRTPTLGHNKPPQEQLPKPQKGSAEPLIVSTSTPIKVQTASVPEPLIEPIQKVNPLQAEEPRKDKDMTKVFGLLQSDRIGTLKAMAKKDGVKGTQKFKKDDKQALITEIMKAKYGKSWTDR